MVEDCELLIDNTQPAPFIAPQNSNSLEIERFVSSIETNLEAATFNSEMKPTNVQNVLLPKLMQ